MVGCGVIFRSTRPAFPKIWAPQLAKLTELQQFDSRASLHWGINDRCEFCLAPTDTPNCFFEAATHSWSHQELSNKLLRAIFDFVFIALHAKVGAKTYTPD
jgi:hypothetical protein